MQGESKAKDLLRSFASVVVGVCWAVSSFLKKKDADELFMYPSF